MRLFKKSNSIWQSRGWFLLPSLAGVTLFVILPFGYMLFSSFSNGFVNYKTVLANEAFHLAVKNTLWFTGVGIPLLLFFSFAAALGIYKSKYMRLLKSVYLLPMAVPTAVVVLIWKVFFHKAGVLNQILELFQIQAADWLSGGMAFWVLIISYIWKNLGYTIVLWLAGMSAIPTAITEAARVDGAGEWQSFIRVGLPAAQGGILAAMILSFLESWNMMEEPLTFMQDKSLWPLSLYLPEIAMDQAGYACGASVITLTVSLFVFAIFHDALEQGIITSGLKA